MHFIVKPHHFLDFLYETAENSGVFSEVHPYGHAMGLWGNRLARGEVDSVEFTDAADDACAPCKNLCGGICTDVFSPEEAALYGFERKYDNSMKLDHALSDALPQVFAFNVARPIDEVYAQLAALLTPEIILLNWPRPDRAALTARGLEMLTAARRRQLS